MILPDCVGIQMEEIMYSIPGRFKVAIWGVTEAIWGCVREEINPFNTEIVTFIDSDKYKHHMVFHNIPIVSLDEFDKDNIDYVLITAYSGMQSILESLIKFGVSKEKIAPCISPGLLSYDVGDISDTAWEASLKLYVEPEKMGELVRRYVDQYEKYSKMKPFNNDKVYWNTGKHLISHACGGYVNGIPHMYTNSKEALQYTLSNGFELMECDVGRLPDGEWVLVHRWGELFDAWEYNYTTLSLDVLLLALSKEKITCLIDVKWDQTQDYLDFVQHFDDMLSEGFTEELKERIVLEAYDEETIKAAVDAGFQVFFTQYRNPEQDNYMNTALLCEKYGVKVIGFGVQYILTNLKKNIGIFIEKGIDIYGFSTDRPEEYSELRRSGVYGIFTNKMRNCL